MIFISTWYYVTFNNVKTDGNFFDIISQLKFIVMKKQLDLIITGGEVFLPNSSIEKIDIGVKDSKIVGIR